MSAPRTEAGKRLLDRLALPWTPDMGAGYEAMIEGIRPVILAIEDEAAALAPVSTGLDVERLARAVRGKDPSAMFVILAGHKGAGNILGEGFAHDLAVIIASEYAALSEATAKP